MRIAQIRKMDISNGPGIRVSIFTQGCSIHCQGCFNHDLWDYSGGEQWTEKMKNRVLLLCASDQISGLSILGGEPLSTCNLSELVVLCKEFKHTYPNKTIWLWTGYTIESLTPDQLSVISLVDVVVDGPWVMDKGDFRLRFRGSSNQRVLVAQDWIQNRTISLLREED